MTDTVNPGITGGCCQQTCQDSRPSPTGPIVSIFWFSLSLIAPEDAGTAKKYCRRGGGDLFVSAAPPVNSESPALAVIDGTLCQLTREGLRAGGHSPLASAVVEFRRGSLRYYVREHPFGILPGLPNLYCLDGAFRLQWMAEWPDANDPCAGILGEDGNTLVAVSSSGVIVRLDVISGRLLAVEHPIAAAS